MWVQQEDAPDLRPSQIIGSNPEATQLFQQAKEEQALGEFIHTLEVEFPYKQNCKLVKSNHTLAIIQRGMGADGKQGKYTRGFQSERSAGSDVE